jgi:hypothetical protein
MHGFTISLARENAKLGVTVNTVSPGYIATDMVMAVPEEVRAKIVADIPTGRLGTSRITEIAYAWRGASSPSESQARGWITGSNLDINGGPPHGLVTGPARRHPLHCGKFGDARRHRQGDRQSAADLRRPGRDDEIDRRNLQGLPPGFPRLSAAHRHSTRPPPGGLVVSERPVRVDGASTSVNHP